MSLGEHHPRAGGLGRTPLRPAAVARSVQGSEPRNGVGVGTGHDIQGPDPHTECPEERSGVRFSRICNIRPFLPSLGVLYLGDSLSPGDHPVPLLAGLVGQEFAS